MAKKANTLTINPRITKLDHLQALQEDDLREKIIIPLLNRMGYKDVRLRHGSQEYGKDIVGTKEDDIAPIRIAVVAKVGGISGQTSATNQKTRHRLDDVRSQVRQAFEMPYDDLISKQKQSIHRVYVWVTGTVSNNAEREIVENTNIDGRNIFYIDGQRTIQWLDQHYPEFFVFADADLSDYYRHAKSYFNRVDALRAIGSAPDKVTLANLFVMPDLLPLRVQSKSVPSSRKSHPASGALERLSIDRLLILHRRYKVKRNILILGEAGSGKSTILRRIALQMIEQNERQFQTNDIPLLVELRSLDLSHPTPITAAMYQQYYRKVASNTPVILDDGKFMLLLDGLDELKSNELINMVLEHVRVFTKSYPQTQIIMTSRFSQIISRSSQRSVLPTFKPYRIAPLSLPQMTKFIKNWFGNESTPASEKLIQYISHPTGLYGLPATPLTLAVVATLFDNGQQELPANLTELFTKYFELLLGRWDTDKLIQQQIEWKIKHSFLADFAWDLHMEHGSIFDRKRIESAIPEWVYKRALPDSSTTAFLGEIERSEIFIERAEGLEFKHRTFQEYFASYAIANRDDAAMFQMIDENWCQDWWNMTIFFACGMKPDASRYLDRLIHHIPQEITSQSMIKYAHNLGMITQAMYLASRDIKKQSVLHVLQALTVAWNIQSVELESKFPVMSGALKSLLNHVVQTIFFALHSLIALGSVTLMEILIDCVKELKHEKDKLATDVYEWYAYLLSAALFCAGDLATAEPLMRTIKTPTLLNALAFLVRIENVIGFFPLEDRQKIQDLENDIISQLRRRGESVKALLEMAPTMLTATDIPIFGLLPMPIPRNNEGLMNEDE